MLRFGTDGIRGDAEADLISPLVRTLGRAAARVLGSGHGAFVIGRDTRRSGPRIEADLVAGIVAEGGRVMSAGVLPTPGVAFLAGERDAPAAMISASHNPFSDNGIKFFACGGRKLPDETEAEIEAELRALLGAGITSPDAPGAEPVVGGRKRYVEHVVGAIEGRRLDGLRVIVDAANGAASEVGPEVLRALGADVEVISADPDGVNINAGCGSTHPEALRRAVVAAGAHVGLALDGDADRVIAVDETGALVDGDAIMVIAALDLHERGRLRNGAVAVTVMSNLGLRRALTAAGIEVVETAVGDRQVLAAMEERGLSLGGEQSGHVVFADLASTGDGVLTGVMLLDRIARSGRSLSELAAAMTRLPQVLDAVRVEGRPALDGADGVWTAVRAVEEQLRDRGRVLVRASGTEPVVRVMVEAETEAEARTAVVTLRAAVEAVFGARRRR